MKTNRLKKLKWGNWESLQSKSSNTDMNNIQHSNEEMKGVEEIEPVGWWRQRFGRLVPTAGSASLTRRTVVTATGTGPTNPMSSTSDWFYPLTPLTLSLSSWSHCLFVITVWLHCLTAIVDWLHTIFHPDPYYLAANSLRAFTSLNTWLWLA